MSETVPTGRQVRTCQRCGDKIEAAEGGAWCYGCRLTAFAPYWYERAERYTPISDFSGSGRPIMLATRRPRTGVQLLDLPLACRISDIAGHISAGEQSPRARRLRAFLQRMAIREGQVGLTDDL